MMSSSCLSGGGSTIPHPHNGFHLDLLHSARSPPSSSSLASTLSDSTNSPLLSLSVSTRKPRSTPRKRPNQTYYEAASLLSTACPNVFSSSPLLTLPPYSHHRPPPHHSSSPHDSSQLFLPDDEAAFLIHHPSQDQNLLPFLKETGPSPSCHRSCQAPDDSEIQSKAVALLHDEYDEDFDTESMLDEELEEGIIDSIMGEKRGCEEDKSEPGESEALKLGPSLGRSPMELVGLGGRLGLWYHGIRKAGGGSGWRDVGQVNWCNFLTVDVNEISPKLNPYPASSSKNNSAAAEKKKKADKAQTAADVSRNRNRSRSRTELGSPATVGMGLGVNKMLKLDYNNVLEAWTGRGRGSPFPDDTPSSDVAGRVDEVMELIVEGMREESVQRHKEKRRSRPFTTTTTTTKKKMR